MKLWHKLRNGAYFVDLILLIAAVIAMVGLATFVHFHASKAPDQASNKGTIGINPQHIETLGLAETSDTTSTPTPDTSPQTVGPADSTASSGLQSAVTAPEATSPAIACKNSCDDIELSTPEIKTPTPIGPITVEPIKIPVKPCNGLVNRALNSVLKADPDRIECPL